jgi:hypothetical protein
MSYNRKAPVSLVRTMWFYVTGCDWMWLGYL